MKFSILFTFSLALSCAYGQEDSLGVNDSPFLNMAELNLLNAQLANQRKEFDFTGKRVAFISGKNGSEIISKSSYFGNRRRTGMMILSMEEKIQSGGFDALVFNSVILFTKRQKRKTLQKLRATTK